MSKTLGWALEGIKEAKQKNLNEVNLSASLMVDFEKLTSLPTELLELTHLESIDLSDNRIKEVPDDIRRFKNLKSINLIGNPLQAVADIPGLMLDFDTYLTLKGYISSENITGINIRLRNKELPTEIFDFQNLTSLNLGGNRLTTVPESITRLQNLTSLDLRDNQLTAVPESITDIEGLFSLHLESNPLVNPPPAVADKGIEAIRAYFQQLKKEGQDYLYEAKLLIVGEGGAGKTSLARKINDINYELQEEKSTEGIEVIPWEFTMENDQQYSTRSWKRLKKPLVK